MERPCHCVLRGQQELQWAIRITPASQGDVAGEKRHTGNCMPLHLQGANLQHATTVQGSAEERPSSGEDFCCSFLQFALLSIGTANSLYAVVYSYQAK
jgi:hypothetical protein